MIGIPTHARRISVPHLHRLGALAGIESWPAVLDLYPTTDHPGEPARRAEDDLGALDLWVDDAPTPWAETVLGVLAFPDREIELRTITDEGMTRAYLARRGRDHIAAVRRPDGIDLRIVEITDDAELGRVVSGLGGPSDTRHLATIEFTEFSVPAAEFVSGVEWCTSADDMASALVAIGVGGMDAVRVAQASTHTLARTEIVATSRGGCGMVQACGAIGVLDTDRGRILLVPGNSPDGSTWVTVTPGRHDRLGRAVRRLVETLPGGRWFD